MTTAETIHALQAALDHLADALVTGEPDRVLAAEERLATAVGLVAALPRPITGDRFELRAKIHAAQLALSRCQRLGRASADLERTVRPEPAYGPPHSRGHHPLSSLVDSRT